MSLLVVDRTPADQFSLWLFENDPGNRRRVRHRVTKVARFLAFSRPIRFVARQAPMVWLLWLFVFMLSIVTGVVIEAAAEAWRVNLLRDPVSFAETILPRWTLAPVLVCYLAVAARRAAAWWLS